MSRDTEAQSKDTDVQSRLLIIHLHKTTEHLFCVFWWPRICKADECTINCCPSTPLQLKKSNNTFLSTTVSNMYQSY